MTITKPRRRGGIPAPASMLIAMSTCTEAMSQNERLQKLNSVGGDEFLELRDLLTPAEVGSMYFAFTGLKEAVSENERLRELYKDRIVKVACGYAGLLSRTAIATLATLTKIIE